MTPGSKNGWFTRTSRLGRQRRRLPARLQRYTLAIKNTLDAEGGQNDSVETTTRLAQILQATQ
jgi:hypothetical protein